MLPYYFFEAKLRIMGNSVDEPVSECYNSRSETYRLVGNARRLSMPVTMRDVARAAGVSVTTVSYVLTQRPGVTIRPETFDRVRREARRLNYRHNAHAADLRRGATRLVEINLYSLSVTVLAQKVASLERGLRASGLLPILCHAEDADAEGEFFKECLARRACGVVLTSPPSDGCFGLLNALTEAGAVVVSSEPIPGSPIPYVTVDRRGGALLAARHLLSLGHRRIAVVVGFTGLARAEFLSGYRAALAGAGIGADASLVRLLARGGGYFEAGRGAARELLALPELPTAVLTTDEEVALGLLRQIQRSGLSVPRDIALVACDNTPLGQMSDVPLTTLAQPVEEVGMELAGMVSAGLNDRGALANRQIRLPMELVIRASCGAMGRPVPNLNSFRDAGSGSLLARSRQGDVWGL
jgi:DNA-binding LacI/PurR family transcriptional regulator